MRRKTTLEPASEESVSQVGLPFSKITMFAPHFGQAQAHTHTPATSTAHMLRWSSWLPCRRSPFPRPPSHTQPDTCSSTCSWRWLCLPTPLRGDLLRKPGQSARVPAPVRAGAHVCARKGRRGQRAGTCLRSATVTSQNLSAFPAGAEFHPLGLENEGQSLLPATWWGG